MLYRKIPLSDQNVFISPSHDTLSQQPLRGVRQDKRANMPARNSTTQPARIVTPSARIGLNNPVPRSKNHVSPNAPLVQLPLWVKPIVKAEVQRMAEMNGFSPSAQGADLLEEILRQKLHIQQAATLETAIERIITRVIGKRDNRLALLLIRIFLVADEGRSFGANILSRQPGVTAKKFDEILDGAADKARKKITHSSPQIDDLLKILDGMLSDQEGRGTER